MASQLSAAAEETTKTDWADDMRGFVLGREDGCVDATSDSRLFTLIVGRPGRLFTERSKSFVDFDEFLVQRFISSIGIGMVLHKHMKR